MSRNPDKAKRHFWKRIGKFFDISRKIILNLVFWSFLLLIILVFLPQRIRIKENSLLYVKPEGSIVDAVSPQPYPSGLIPFLSTMEESSSIELGEVIRAAAEDDKIPGIILDLSNMQYASLAILQDLEQDLNIFKETGKKIYAWAPEYNQYAYYLASLADIVYLDRMGRLTMSGFGVFRSYYKKGMDKWDLDMAVFKAGTYKSYVEPYSYDHMSDQVKRENLRWTTNLWDQVLNSIATNRGLTYSELKNWVDRYPQYLLEADNQEAQSAANAGLVDRVGTWDTFASEMTKITGYDTDNEGFRSVHWLDYQTHLSRKSSSPFGKTVAVVTASGDIHSGEGTQWTIGSATLISRLEQAEKESSVRAIVLRLDTGGGSAYASEEIRRTLERIRARGISVVVSMGGVTASGGYWIASEADQLWSAPGTITGSIGVFSMIPETDRFLEEHLGIAGDGAGTTWMSGQGRSDQALNRSSRMVLQSGVDSTYHQFLSLVSENRNIPLEELRPLAEGRIWTGTEAKRIGLCDNTGSLRNSVQAAADLAHLEEYNTWYVPGGTPFLKDIASSFLSQALTAFQGGGGSAFHILELTENLSDLKTGKVYALSPISNRGKN
ncbi:MAG: signal peptide peptidase SppA [Spirochaetaceae bacterium 4572_59]|nr:MAG: signal peptide peptidase SppA [Spirochaetaceae bacterium 4572_59]